MNTKKTLLVCITAFAGISISSAQNYSKQVVNVDDFTYQKDQFSASEVLTVRSNVIKSLQATNRIIVVDLMNQSSIQNEAERRKSEAAMNDEREVADMTQLNANYILKGELNSINIGQKQTTNSETGKTTVTWNGEMNITVHLINAATGGVDKTNTYKSTSYSNTSAEDARQKLINDSNNMNKLVEEVFPLKGTILQIADGDNKKAKTVYIDLGSVHGIQKGQKLIVYVVMDIAGEKSEQEIGTLTVQEVLSEYRALCKVNEAGNEIAKNLTKNIQMTIQTRAKKGIFADIDFHL